MSNTVLSIIICTCNRAAFLRETLESLGTVDVPADLPAELVLVDNASTDGTAEVGRTARLPNMPVRYVFEGRRGQSHARNMGLSVAQGQIIVFTDDDLRFPADWLSGMARPLLTGAADAVAGGVHTAPVLERPWMTPGHPAHLASTARLDPDSPDTMVGANMAFRRAVLERVPAFDTDLGPGALGFGDDTLFSWQIREAGFRLVSTFGTSVEHHFDPDRLRRTSLLRMAQSMGRSGGYLAYHWKHEALPLPAVRLAKCRLWLGAWRLAHPKALRQEEGMAAAEIELVQKVALLEQYREEQKRPHHYDRRGLVRRERA